MAPKLKKRVVFVTMLIYREPPDKGHGYAIKQKHERETGKQCLYFTACLANQYHVDQKTRFDNERA